MDLINFTNIYIEIINNIFIFDNLIVFNYNKDKNNIFDVKLPNPLSSIVSFYSPSDSPSKYNKFILF